MTTANLKISVIVPTLNGAQDLQRLLQSLQSQTCPPEEIIVIDSASDDRTVAIARQAGVHVIQIQRQEFDHGHTRNLAASQAHGEVLVFMTQDALPANDRLLECLTLPLQQREIVACYARQLPRATSPITEQFARHYNYPDQSHVTSASDIERKGIKAFFFSNVCSAIKRDSFERVGQFPVNVIMNEDMIMAAQLLQQGYQIAYAAEAQVIHAHDYSLWQQFKRNFDIGVALRQHRDILSGAKTGGAGIKFVRQQFGYLWQTGHRLAILQAFGELFAKYGGYRLGQAYRWLPRSVCWRVSNHRGFWLK